VSKYDFNQLNFIGEIRIKILRGMMSEPSKYGVAISYL